MKLSVRRAGGIVSLTVFALFVIVIARWQTIFKMFAPPIPIVASYGGDDLSSTLGDYSIRVWASVRNDGGDGEVVLEATVYQGEHHWTKTATRRLTAKETARMEIDFDEVALFDADPKYKVWAYPVGLPIGGQ